MEQAQSGFELQQDEEKFVRIMLHANADSRVGKFLYMLCSRTELNELITIVVEYLIVCKLGNNYYVN